MNRGGTSRKKIKGKITLTDRRRFLEQLKDGLIGFFSTNTYTSELGRGHRVGRAEILTEIRPGDNTGRAHK
jgi:hypothetical protein